VANQEQRRQCEKDFRAFCIAYFPLRFDKPFSSNHEKVIKKIEYSIFSGGLFACAMPRGEGKTTLCETASIWATLYGHSRYCVIVGSDKPAAEQILKSIKIELETNDLLVADFPEVCIPFKSLDGIANRSKGQTCNGQLTHISFKTDEIIFPHIEGSITSGTVIQARGLTGRIRGLKHTTAEGKTLRPDFVIPDDPQTEESAYSETQCAQREKIVRSAIMGLAGPGKEISAIMPCTIIRQGDFADRMLDKKRNPEWRGEICKMITSWPTNTELWEHYKMVYLQGMENEDNDAAANAFYLANRAQLEEGASVAWEHRKTDNNVSALQHAMNLLIKVGKFAFMSEYQNEPMADDQSSALPSAKDLEQKVNSYPRNIVPLQCEFLTMGIDLHDRLLYYVVTGWDSSTCGYIVDYGTMPDQQLGHFQLDNAPRTLQVVYNAGKLGSIQQGLLSLVKMFISKQFTKSNQALIGISKILIDGGYHPEIAHNVKREIGSSIVDISRGVGVTAAQQPMTEYKRKPGEKHGHNWYYPLLVGTREFQHVRYDANFWKTQILLKGIAIPSPEQGNITLFGNNTTNHRLISEHLVASEIPVETEGRGRKCVEWQLRPARPDNHFLDCLSMSAIAASIAGLNFCEPKEKERKARVKLSEIQRTKFSKN
jgi:hypothetical protein